MKEKKEAEKLQKTVAFAGKKYVIEQNATAKEKAQFAKQEAKKLGGGCNALDQLCGLIDDGHKNINAV